MVARIDVSNFKVILAHHGPTESRFFARARATNGLGTFSGLLWKVLRGFKNISRGALGDNGHKGQPGGGLVPPEPPRGTLYPPKKLYLPKPCIRFILL